MKDTGTTIELYMQSMQNPNIATRNIDFPVSLHMHNFYEIEMIISGSGYNVINGIPFPLARGLLYLLTPNDTHQIDCTGQLTIIHAGFLPDPENGLSLPLPDGGYIVQLTEQEIEPLMHFFTLAETECNAQHPWRMQAVHAYLSLVIIHLLRHGRQCAATSIMQKLQPALMYIWQHCSNEMLDLQTVAATCNLSPSYFSSVFHKTLGRSFTAYLIECRLRCACYLLTETEMNISEIVYKCGFSSPSRFFRVFKSYFACTPGDYRLSHSSNSQKPADENIPISLWRRGTHIISTKVDTK